MATSSVESHQHGRRSSSIATLRDSATSVFSNKGYRNVVWAGAFGPFARGEQDESSDVNVVVVWNPAKEIGWQPLNDIFALDLDEELTKVFGRDVDVKNIGRGQIRSYHDVEALLSSRTLYGSEQDRSVVKLQKDARDILDSGIALFQSVFKKIDEARIAAGKLDFEEFKASNDVRRNIRDQVYAILRDLDIHPERNPLRLNYYDTIIEPVTKIRENLKLKLAERGSDQLDSAYWHTVWQIACQQDKKSKGLVDLHQSIRVLILPDLQYTVDLSQKVQTLAAEDEHGVPAVVYPEDGIR
ncbi:MAG: hypothetical protein M1830_009970 [Pleopsidium flavum]|nr:MAG: hypothetical protein M1830_009970 [Pleopsidium flavum]